MFANAATFHQVESLNDYVNQTIEQNGWAYATANVFAHIGAYSLYAAGAVWAWSAVGLPTWGVGVGHGRNGIHFIFGATRYGGGSMTWMHAVGGGSGGTWIIGAPSYYVSASYTFTGIPIIFPGAAVGGSYAYNCFTAAAHSLWKGWFYW